MVGNWLSKSDVAGSSPAPRSIIPDRLPNASAEEARPELDRVQEILSEKVMGFYTTGCHLVVKSRRRTSNSGVAVSRSLKLFDQVDPKELK